MEANFSMFNRLVISPNYTAQARGIEGGEWTKGEVLVELVETNMIECYKNTNDWAEYILMHVLGDVDAQYEEDMIISFLNSVTGKKLVLDLGDGAVVELIKCIDD